MYGVVYESFDYTELNWTGLEYLCLSIYLSTYGLLMVLIISTSIYVYIVPIC